MLIKRFHELEEEAELFSLTDDKGYPIWDIFRYYVFIKYYYPKEEVNRLSISESKQLKDYYSFLICLIKFFYSIFFTKKKKILIQTMSRFKRKKLYYDKISAPIIELLNNNCVILESYARDKIEYKTIYDFSSFIRRFNRTSNLDMLKYEYIREKFLNKFGCFELTYNELNTIYHNFQSDVSFYNIIIKKLSPSKIFLATGNPKAILCTAKKNNIKTFLFQHAGIFYEEIEYSYPPSIDPNSNLLFADIFFTLGNYWGRDMNIPTKQIITLGSNYYYKKVSENIKNEDIILIISTIIHGQQLAEFIHTYAKDYPSTNFIFKLHPNEFKIKNHYLELFKNNKNITIISSEKDTSEIITEAKLVILIVSTVLYEALDMNKKVAIYKKLNYARNNYLASQPNLYFFESKEELDKIIEKKIIEITKNDKFYSPFNKEVLKKFL